MLMLLLRYHSNLLDIVMVETKFGILLEECKNIEFVDQKIITVENQ